MTKNEYESWRDSLIHSENFKSSTHRIQMMAIWEKGDPPLEDFFDVSKQFNDLFLGFANGCYEEARVVGENADSIVAFCRVMEIGGYTFTEKAPTNAHLYVPGDLCFPAPEPFVFVSLKPDPELVDAACARRKRQLHKAIESRKKEDSQKKEDRQFRIDHGVLILLILTLFFLLLLRLSP